VFRATKARIEALIHPPVESGEDEENNPEAGPMIRFTNVTDNVE